MPVGDPSNLRCPACGYDLRTSRPIAPCTECGNPAADALRPSLVNHGSPAALLAGVLGFVSLAAGPLLLLAILIAEQLGYVGAKSLLLMIGRQDQLIATCLIVWAMFLVTCVGRSPALRPLRRRALVVRIGVIVLAVLCWLGIRDGSFNAYAGVWGTPPTATPLIYLIPGLYNLTLVAMTLALARFLWGWADAARDRSARVLIALTCGLVAILPAAAAIHVGAGALYAMHTNATWLKMHNSVALESVSRVVIIVAEICFLGYLAVRFTRTSLAIRRKQRLQ